MRTANVLASLLLVAPMGAGCESAEPMENVPGEFGDPCVDGSASETPDGCATDLICWQGYCEESCVEDSDCQTVEGWVHECVAGQCQIYCDANQSCPQTLNAPLECWVNGMWCAGIDET